MQPLTKCLSAIVQTSIPFRPMGESMFILTDTLPWGSRCCRQKTDIDSGRAEVYNLSITNVGGGSNGAGYPVDAQTTRDKSSAFRAVDRQASINDFHV